MCAYRPEHRPDHAAVLDSLFRLMLFAGWSPDLPRMAPEDELGGFGGPVAVFASEEDAFFPAQAVLPRAREIFPNLAPAESLRGCRHIPSKAGLERVNERILAFLAGPEES